MNILLIEDERALVETGKAQLEAIGHTVHAAFDIAEARAVLEDETRPVNLVITDHRLPDGFGIEFVLELRVRLPALNYVIVSGCLTDRDVDRLEMEGIRYFHKPLLYRKVVEQMQRELLANKPIAEIPEVSPEAEAVADPAPAKAGFWQRVFGRSK